MPPASPAAIAFPSDRKRTLRPSLMLNKAWPTRPRLIATSVGPSNELAIACSTLAATTTLKIGHNASKRALALIDATAKVASRRLAGTRSTSAPPGICNARRDRPDRQNETDVELRPRHRCQIGGNERPPPRLNIGDEKRKPIETAKAALRRHGSADLRLVLSFLLAPMSAFRGKADIGWTCPNVRE